MSSRYGSRAAVHQQAVNAILGTEVYSMSMNESLDAYLSVRLVQAYVRTYPDSLADLKNGFANGYKAGLADSELLEALREIAEGCMNLRPGHVDAGKNRTKAEIENIARAAIAKATGEAGE